MCKEWMPRTVEKFWRGYDKTVVLSPPKCVTWNMKVGTVAGGKQLISQGFMEEQLIE
jgi:hypothetical protein